MKIAVWFSTLVALTILSGVGVTAAEDAAPQRLTTDFVRVPTDELNPGGVVTVSNAVVSGDGTKIAFTWTTDTGRDAYRENQVSLWNTQTHELTLVSAAMTGEPGGAASYVDDITADGRYVSFTSLAEDLVAEDTNGCADAFVRDVVTGTTERVSVSSSGAQAERGGGGGGMSADGRVVVFMSRSRDLVPRPVYHHIQLFAHDTVTGRTTLVSISSSGQPGNMDAGWPLVSDDGDLVVFTTQATNLVHGDTDFEPDVVMRNRPSGRTLFISAARKLPGPDFARSLHAFSGNGRFVAYEQYMSTRGGVEDQKEYVVDRRHHSVERAVRDESGKVRRGRIAGFSPDGRIELVVSWADLTSDETGALRTDADVYLRNRVTGQLIRVSEAASQSEDVHTRVHIARLSADTGTAVILTTAKLSADDTDRRYDLYLRDVSEFSSKG